jgi:hypothetical protein
MTKDPLCPRRMVKRDIKKLTDLELPFALSSDRANASDA